MAKNSKNKRNTKNKNDEKILDDNELTMFDKAAKNIFSVLDDTYSSKNILDSKNKKIRDILNRELEISKGVSQGSIIDFVSSININNKQKGQQAQSNTPPNANDMFTKNINDIFGYFQDLYRNRFIEIQDLKFIAKFIPALGEAVKTVIDSIVASDNIADSVNRAIELPSSVIKEDEISIINEIKRNEDELKLLKKIKNIVFKKACICGVHYVYAVSYNRIFEEYDMIKKQNDRNLNNTMNNQFSNNNKTLMEKANESSFILGDVDISIAMENAIGILSNAKTNDGKSLTKNELNDIIGKCKDEMPIITCNTSDIYFEALESVATIAESEFAFESFKKKATGDNVNNTQKHNPLELTMPDGTISIDEKIKPSKFNISGTYIKYIDAKNIIPLKVFDQVIGYYLIHPKAKKNKNSVGEVGGINSIGQTLFSAVNIGESKKHDAVEKIVNSISEGIMNNFDNKFVTKNSEYKKLIADCIIANGLTNKDYNIQFIPADDIIPFTINENEEGFGESILSDSLFPAKLLLSMIVCRMLNYINKAGNKTIAHIYKGPVNAFTSNQINRVIRDLQEQNVTFNDLLSPNLVFNKFNRDGNIALPTAKNGQHLVEFETQEGQNVDMTPEYEKELENMAILGTGVPSVIMEYTGSADFAKQIVSANIKFAGRIATLQSDLEEPLTLLYKKICENSNLSDKQKVIASQSLKIKLPRPRVITNSNNGEYVQSIVGTAEAIADVAIGRETSTNTEVMPNGVQIKEGLIYEIVKDSAPFIDWEKIESSLEKLKMEFSEEKTGDDSTSSGGGF